MNTVMGMAKYQAEIPPVVVPDLDDPGMMINETARRVYRWGVDHCGLSAEDLVYNWGRETQKLLHEERAQLEAELDELLRAKAPIDRIRKNLQRWANNVLELYKRHHQYRQQQSRRRQRVA